MPSYPSGLSLSIEASSPYPRRPAQVPTLHIHSGAGSASGAQPQRVANAQSDIASCSHQQPEATWDSAAFDMHLAYVRNAGNYREIAAQYGHLPSSFEYEALHDAAQQGARAAMREGMSGPDAAARFHLSSNPDDVNSLMLFAAKELGGR